MEPFEEFEQNLKEMLNHLYDPVYRPPESLWTDLHFNREQGLQPVCQAILTGVEDLKPSDQVPVTAVAWRIYGMLRYRFVDNFSQEMTAEKLGITSRHLRRGFMEALHALALVLWEKSGNGLPELTASKDPPRGKVAAVEENVIPQADWHAQLARELESLEVNAAGSVANMLEISTSVLRLAGYLMRQRGVAFQISPIAPQLMAAIHPSVLRQVLITAIDLLAQQMMVGTISMGAEQAGGLVWINLSADPFPAEVFPQNEPIHKLFASFNLTAEVTRTDNSIRITLALLQVDRRVLVVDDNVDIVHLYRRYLAGTRYYLVYVNKGEQVFEAVEAERPDLVVLDVMLPDVDGWDLLTRLHENNTTRFLPVVICSVMREKELALALGARYVISKPVQRQEFIMALDTVLAKV